MLIRFKPSHVNVRVLKVFNIIKYLVGETQGNVNLVWELWYNNNIFLRRLLKGRYWVRIFLGSFEIVRQPKMSVIMVGFDVYFIFWENCGFWKFEFQNTKSKSFNFQKKTGRNHEYRKWNFCSVLVPPSTWQLLFSESG